MRVVHLCQDFSPLSETFIYDYVTELGRRECECHVVAANLWNRDTRPFENVYHVPWPGSRHPLRLLHRALAEVGVGDRHRASWPEYRRRVRAAVRRIRPDVMHAHFGTTGARLYPLVRELGIPMVVSFHGKDAFVSPTKRQYRETYPKMLKSMSAVTVVSRIMRSRLEDLGADRDQVHLVRVGKHLDEYPFRQPGRGRVREWISVGRLTEKKGHRDAIAAFEEVIQDHPDQRLRIVGDGPLRGQIEELVREQGLSEHVKLVGAVDHKSAKRMMAAADAFLLCSRTAANGDREGVPTVLMEAQLLGLPCVTTTHSGIPEVIPDDNQWLLSPEGDVPAIAAAMRALLAADWSTRMSVAEAGRAKVEAEFNLSLETERLVSLYHAVTERIDKPSP